MSETSLIWLVAGSAFCVLELVTPVAFVWLAMGWSAFLVAPTAATLPSNMQVVLWMVLSLVLFGVSHFLVAPTAATLPFNMQVVLWMVLPLGTLLIVSILGKVP